MSVYGRKLTASLLALCLILGLAACGDGGEDSDAERLSGPIYVPEFIELDLELDYVNGGCCDGRYIYILGEISKPQLYNGQGELVRDLPGCEASSSCASWPPPSSPASPPAHCTPSSGGGGAVSGSCPCSSPC